MLVPLQGADAVSVVRALGAGMLMPLQGAAARFCCAAVRVVCGLEAGVLVLLQGAAAGCRCRVLFQCDVEVACAL